MKHDPLADALSTIRNAENVGKPSCTVPASTLIRNVLASMQEKGYIGEYEFVDDNKSGFFKVSLLGKINDCGVIKPKFTVQTGDFVKWEKRYLPADGFGYLIITTPEGILTHEEAREQETGGQLIGYVY